MSRRIFEKAGFTAPKKSAFDLSREKKLSFNMGELIPAFWQEILPGDEFMVNSEIMLRFAPMVFPVMHRVDVYMHYFFVPNRLIWTEWEDFITGGMLGATEPDVPVINGQSQAGNLGQGSLADYFGIPPSFDGINSSVSALPFRAYTKIYNEYYRDPNLMSELSETDPNTVILLQNRCWEKDYFTSALPWSQRGNQPGIPVDFNYKDASDYYHFDGTEVTDSAASFATPSTQENNESHLRDSGDTSTRVENLQEEGVSVNVNELRRVHRIQKWLETAARGGYRYIEQLASRFGIQSSDARLQRPEYLGGGKQPVTISEVLNTTGTTDHPQGDMAGHGVSVGSTNTFRKFFEEHGIVIGIMSVLPRSAYQQGIHRSWRRFDKFDYFQPEFANLGEQEILNQEIYFDSGTPDNNGNTFGYQQRYADYKYGHSNVHGDFRSNPLEDWHLGRIFSNPPSLNGVFVEFNHVNFHRIFANTDSNDDKLWCQIFHSVKARRPMPYFADPRL